MVVHKSSGNRDETVANKIQIKETLDFLLVFVLIQSNATLIFFKRYLDIKETFVFNLFRLLIVYVGDFRQHCGGEFRYVGCWCWRCGGTGTDHAVELQCRCW